MKHAKDAAEIPTQVQVSGRQQQVQDPAMQKILEQLNQAVPSLLVDEKPRHSESQDIHEFYPQVQLCYSLLNMSKV